MRKYINLCALTLTIGCYPRLDRDADFVIQGISFNSGGFEIDQDMVEYTLDHTRFRVEYQYDLNMNEKQLAKDADLYVMFVPREDTEEICNVENNKKKRLPALGCYMTYVDEIYVGTEVPEEKLTYSEEPGFPQYMECYVRNATLAHEMLHFYSAHVLWEERNEIFSGRTWLEVEEDHTTLGLWRREASGVESHVMEKIDDRCASIHLN